MCLKSNTDVLQKAFQVLWYHIQKFYKPKNTSSATYADGVFLRQNFYSGAIKCLKPVINSIRFFGSTSSLLKKLGKTFIAVLTGTSNPIWMCYKMHLRI